MTYRSRQLAIDIETYSSVDLRSCGLYKYAESPDLEILLFSYCWLDEGIVHTVDLANGEEIPKHILDALTFSDVTKTAYNAAFEIACLSRFFDIYPEQWSCTMALGASLGWPLGLNAICEALALPEQFKKDAAGNALIKFFSCPCKPTNKNGKRTRNLPHHDPEKWELYKKYNNQDVVAEMAVRAKLHEGFNATEARLFNLDQRINSKGIKVDMDLVRRIIEDSEKIAEQNMQRAKELTGLANPNSIAQLLSWVAPAADRFGVSIKNLQAGTVEAAIKKLPPSKVKEVLELRRAMSKTSIKKFQAMENAACEDGRVKGLFQFYGSKTGRWAGRLVQMQNLKRNNIPSLEGARHLAKEGRISALEVIYGDPSEVHSQLVRTAFIPTNEDHKLIVCDFSAIEARVLAWLAYEKWVLEVFRTHGKLYEAQAARMFHMELDQVTPARRQQGKVATLALGYGGGEAALEAMGALQSGIQQHELRGIVRAYRGANPAIVAFWRACNDAAFAVLTVRGCTKTVGKVVFGYEAFQDLDYMTIGLPSGRKLYYPRPHFTTNRFGGPSIGYWAVGRTGKWEQSETYGGKLVENITQAVARDCLAESMLRIDSLYRNSIVAHIHDEVVLDVPKEYLSVRELESLMGEDIAWARGLPLRAAGFESEFYKKD